MEFLLPKSSRKLCITYAMTSESSVAQFTSEPHGRSQKGDLNVTLKELFAYLLRESDNFNQDSKLVQEFSSILPLKVILNMLLCLNNIC
jgi:hypothetical protein